MKFLLLAFGILIMSACSQSSGGGGGGGTNPTTSSLTMSSTTPDTQRDGDMVITSAVRTNSSGGSVVVTISGTINGDYAEVTVYFTGGTPVDQHPSFISYSRGGTASVPEHSNTCVDGDPNDCTSTLVQPLDFKIDFTNQLLNNTIDGSSVILNGTVNYSI